MRAGGAALQAGDGETAWQAVAPLIDAGINQPQLWMLYGEAARLSGRLAAQERAADALLAGEPAQPRGLAWKGHCREQDGDRRAAAAYYAAADRAMSALPALPPSLAALHAEVTAATERLNGQFGEAMDEGLIERGIDTNLCSAAFRRSLAIMRGEASETMELQRPANYFYPGLPQRRFYERDEFDWAPAVESATDAIRAELMAALAEQGLFSPYLTHLADRPRSSAALMDDPAWSALHLFQNGEVSAELAERFPTTLAAMANVPLCRISVRAPSVMFSLLQPGARIDPHHGTINARLICHLPLVIPGPGALEVGGEARSWTEGELLIFDDSVQHSAWNDSDADRIVLIFDVWRPEVPESDRAAIAALFETVDAYR